MLDVQFSMASSDEKNIAINTCEILNVSNKIPSNQGRPNHKITHNLILCRSNQREKDFINEKLNNCHFNSHGCHHFI